MSGFVVSRPYATSNVGSNLASLAGAAWFAHRLGRALVVDWRGMTQLQDASLNYFTEFFATPSHLMEVPVLYAPSDAVPDYGETWTEPGEARLLAAERGAAEDVIALRTYHGLDRLLADDPIAQFRFLRSFYREIQPSAAIRHTIDSWAARELDRACVIGINVRTGNGHYFQRGMEYQSRVDVSVFADEDRFLRVLRRATATLRRRFPRALRHDFRIFYATDSRAMSDLLSRLPNSVTRRQTFPPAGAGDTFDFAGTGVGDRDVVVDTIVDMFLLARCDALVYNSSLFNQYARVLTAGFGGNQVHLETRFLRGRLELVSRGARRHGRRA